MWILPGVCHKSDSCNVVSKRGIDIADKMTVPQSLDNKGDKNLKMALNSWHFPTGEGTTCIKCWGGGRLFKDVMLTGVHSLLDVW